MASIRSIGSAYCDFVFGSSADTMVNSIINSYKNRNAFRYGTIESLYQGTKIGMKNSYNYTKDHGGFFTSMWGNLKDVKSAWNKSKIPNASLWKNLKHCFPKIIKPLGKAAPPLLAMIGLVTEVPNIWRATKEEGIVSGLKETGKAAIKLTFGALCGGFGTKLMPVIGSTYGFLLGNVIGDQVGSVLGSNAGEYLSLKAMGDTYSAKHKKHKINLEEIKTEQDIKQQKQQEYEKYRQLVVLKNINTTV